MKIRILRPNQIVITDNGTPSCLPKWAKDELVDYRLKTSDALEALIRNDVPGAFAALGQANLVEMFNLLHIEDPR